MSFRSPVVWIVSSLALMALPGASTAQRLGGEAAPLRERAAEILPAAQEAAECDPDVLCLGAGRFQVRVNWASDVASGQGHPVLLTPTTGYFWFFDQGNVEWVVKILDGCSISGEQWVFANGLTGLDVSMQVTDTTTGRSKTYVNDVPIRDTAAFACTLDSGPMSGDWSGTFDSFDQIDCDSGVGAQATFNQQGSSVDGTLTAEPRGCGAQYVTFHGTLVGSLLSGTISSGSGLYGFVTGSTARGVLAGTSLELTLTSGPPNPASIPGGTMHLHR